MSLYNICVIFIFLFVSEPELEVDVFRYNKDYMEQSEVRKAILLCSGIHVHIPRFVTCVVRGQVRYWGILILMPPRKREIFYCVRGT